jgi:hypothetical protein
MSEEVDDIPDGPLLTEVEAAKDLKVSRSFLAKASMNGTGPEFINAVQPFATRRARSRSTKQRRRLPPRRNTPSASATALVSRSRPAGLGVVGKSRDRSHRGPPRYRPTSSKDIAPVSVAWVGSARGSPNPLRGNPGQRGFAVTKSGSCRASVGYRLCAHTRYSRCLMLRSNPDVRQKGAPAARGPSRITFRSAGCDAKGDICQMF